MDGNKREKKTHHEGSLVGENVRGWVILLPLMKVGREKSTQVVGEEDTHNVNPLLPLGANPPPAPLLPPRALLIIH